MDIEDDEDEELICARIFNLHKECMVNDNITVRLEEIEHLYEEFAWKQLIPSWLIFFHHNMIYMIDINLIIIF